MKTEIRGAEAIVRIEDEIVIKERIPKKYRNNELDKRLISKRTRTEANILKKLKHIPGFPKIMDNTSNTIIIERIKGKPLSKIKIDNDNEEIIIEKITELLHLLHSKKIVHGDLTPKNIIIHHEESEEIDVSIIDFGLAQTSHRIEDKANDIWMTRETFIIFDGFSEKLINSYLSKLDDKERVLFKERIEKMSQRGRHRNKTK